MYGLNHWIPRPSFQTRLYHLHPCRRAFAGMTVGAAGNDGGGGWGVAGRGSVGMATNSCQPPLSFQRRLESRKRGRGGEWLTGSGRRRVGGHPPGCHSRSAGMYGLNHWIPAFAGMTVGAAVGIFLGMANGLSGWRQTHANPHRHSSESWNPGNGGAVVKG